MKIWDEKYVNIGCLDMYMNGKQVVSVRRFGCGYQATSYLGSGSQDHFFEPQTLDMLKKDVEAWYAGELKNRLVLMERIAEDYKKQIEELEVPESLEQQIQCAENQRSKLEISSVDKNKGKER